MLTGMVVLIGDGDRARVEAVAAGYVIVTLLRNDLTTIYPISAICGLELGDGMTIKFNVFEVERRRAP